MHENQVPEKDPRFGWFVSYRGVGKGNIMQHLWDIMWPTHTIVIQKNWPKFFNSILVLSIFLEFLGPGLGLKLGTIFMVYK